MLDSLPQEVKDIVICKWWTNETMISPNKKKVISQPIGCKLDEKHACHYLEVSQVHLNQSFFYTFNHVLYHIALVQLVEELIFTSVLQFWCTTHLKS